MFSIKQIPRILLLSLLYFLFLISSNDGPLYDQDEAAYAGFAKQMLSSGDFILQEFPFSEPHKKPPLHLWFTAASFYLCGTSEFSLRIFPALWIVLTCLMAFFIAKHLFDEKIAEISFLIMATSIYFPLNGKIALVDALLTFCQTLGFYALTKILIPKDNTPTKWVLLFWASIVFGSLTKGPPIFLFLGGVAFACLFFEKTRKLVLQLKPWYFLPLSLLPIILWGYLAWERTDGKMIRWMLDWYVFRRVTSPVFGQSGPPGTYLLLFFLTLFPWSFYLPSVFKKLFISLKEMRSSQKKGSPISPLAVVFLSGLFFSWVVYEFLMSKLPSYTLAAYPIIAILIAKSYEESKKVSFKKWILAFAILQTLAIHVFLSPYLNTFRADTKNVAKKWNKSIPDEEPFYVLKNYGIPSFAYYSNHKLIVLEDVQEFKTIPQNSYLLLDPELYQLLSHFGLSAIEVESPEKIFAYDRNKTIELMLVRTK